MEKFSQRTVRWLLRFAPTSTGSRTTCRPPQQAPRDPAHQARQPPPHHPCPLLFDARRKPVEAFPIAGETVSSGLAERVRGTRRLTRWPHPRHPNRAPRPAPCRERCWPAPPRSLYGQPRPLARHLFGEGLRLFQLARLAAAFRVFYRGDPLRLQSRDREICEPVCWRCVAKPRLLVDRPD